MAMILVVEDDDNNFELLSWDLEELRHGFRRATNAEDAVQMAGANNFDLVLMDIIIPPRDGEPHNHQYHGIQASVDIRALRPALPIIAITAYVTEAVKRQIRETGCSILDKDCGIEPLQECISTCLAAVPLHPQI